MLLIIIIILAVLALGGGFGYAGPRYGTGGYIGPVALVLIILAILYFAGVLHQ